MSINSSFIDNDIYKFNSSKLMSNSNKNQFDKEFFIGKDVDDYFNDILNSKDKKNNYKILNTSSTFKNFYEYYILPNTLLIVLLVAVVIFFVIRYLCLNIKSEKSDKFNNVDSKKTNTTNTNVTDATSTSVDIKENDSVINVNELKIKKDKEQLRKEKKEIRREKLKILEIIDELSVLNANASTGGSKNTETFVDNNGYNDSYDDNDYGYDNNEYNNHGMQSHMDYNNGRDTFDNFDNFSNYSNINSFENDNTILKKYGNNYTQNFPNNQSQMTYGSFQEADFDNGSFQSLSRNIDSSNIVNDVYIEPPYL
jgi:hypothetical protein